MNRTLDMSPATTRYLRVAGWTLAALLLALPAVAMQFDRSGVNWSGSDFAFAAVVFGIVGGTLEAAARASNNLTFRLASAVAVLTAFLTVWISLAVGIVGEPENALNLVYFGVIAAAAAGTITAGRKAGRLARAMIVTAMFQVLICFAHALDRIMPALAIDAFFAFTWFIAGLLFARSAKQQQAGS